MLKITRKKGVVRITFAPKNLKSRKSVSKTASSNISFFRKVRDYLGFKFKIFGILLKALGANPKKISLKEGGGETLLLVSRKKSRKHYFRNLIRSFSKAFRQPEKKIVKATAVISTIALLLQLSISLMPTTEANNLCPADADVVLVMDLSYTMADGGSQSACRWCEIKWYEEGGTNTWFLNTKYNVNSDWCSATRDQFDESIPYFQSCSPNFVEAKKSKIDDAKAAANSFLDNLKTTDQSALVSLKSTADLVRNLSNNHSSLKTDVSNLITGGTDATNIGDAIAQANIELGSERVNPGANKVIILLTDGKANKPNGYGYGEYADDVTYAQTKAQEAASSGQKIFTIGLGSASDINETMLRNIASTTGGQYYYASESSQLTGIYSEIYGQINTKTCEFASISGCKYLDIDSDGDISGATTTLSGWEIVLSGDASSTQITDQNGCYSFEGLSAGNYTVSEGENTDKNPFLQTYPASKTYNLNLVLGQKSQNIDFGNADKSLCKAAEISRQCIGDGKREITYGTVFNYCGESYKEIQDSPACSCAYTDWQDEECSALGQRRQTRSQISQFDYCTVLSQNRQDASCTEPIGPICGNSLLEQGEVCDNNSQACVISGYNGMRSCNHTCDGWNACQTSESCGDGIKNGPEACDDGNTQNGDGCSSTCQTEATEPQTGGSGGGFSVGSIITSHLEFTSNSFKNAGAETDSIIITWLTNIPATSRVIYDTVAHPVLGEAPNYGYAFSTIEDTNKVTFHSVEVTGLTPSTTYFWRVISSASPEIVSEELTFSTVEALNLDEIAQQLKTMREQVDAITKDLNPAPTQAPQVLAIEKPIIEQGPVENQTTTEENVVNENVEESLPLTEEIKEESKTNNSNLLAAIGNFFNNRNSLGFLGLIVIIIAGLYILARNKKKNEQQKIG